MSNCFAKATDSSSKIHHDRRQCWEGAANYRAARYGVSVCIEAVMVIDGMYGDAWSSRVVDGTRTTLTVVSIS